MDATNISRCVSISINMAGSWHIVLPTKTASSDELSDADLEKVAGGGNVVTFVSTVVASIGAAGAGVSAIAGAAAGSAAVSAVVASAIVGVSEGW